MCQATLNQSYTRHKHVYYIYTVQYKHIRTTLKQMSNWPPSFCYNLGKVFGENTINQI